MKVWLPSRILNETGFSLLGLSGTDLIGVLATYSILNSISFFFDFGPMPSLLTSCASFLFLVFVRAKFRRHYIRDMVLHAFIKIFRGGTGYDPSDNR